MQTTSEFLSDDHHACDTLWAEVEQSADAQDTDALRARFSAFAAAMERHFSFEEETLFVALDNATGMHGMGPTAVMRAEHAQMRRVLHTMAGALAGGDTAGVMDHGDTLLMLVQQHNMKEEHILYPLADARLAAAWPELQAAWRPLP
jgi:hemerythrin-like domain-containing protein